MAAELVRARVDVIVALNSDAAAAVKGATDSIPVVFMLQDTYLFLPEGDPVPETDPVAAGLVRSFAQPGGNITGVTWPPSSLLAAKRLELLAEAFPDVRRVGVLLAREPSGALWGELEAAARTRGVELLPLTVRHRSDLAGVLTDGVAAGVQALLRVEHIPSNFEDSQGLIAFAQQHHLPLVMNNYGYGVISYVPSSMALWATGAAQVDRLLRGATPAETPVEQVREFELSINLDVAQKSGLTVAPPVLARATEVRFPGAAGPTQVR